MRFKFYLLILNLFFLPLFLFSLENYYPTNSWRTSSPEAQGMDSDILSQMVDLIQTNNWKLMNINSILVIRHGFLVEEANFYPTKRDSINTIQSCTKSITSILFGIALDKGLIKDLNQKVVDYFPEITITNLDDRKKYITLENLLTMTSCFDWPEWDIPYESNENVAIKMNHFVMNGENCTEYILNRPITSRVGEWQYNSGAAHLLSAIIRKVCKMNEKDFIKQNLFKPLGITNYSWPMDAQSNCLGWTGLRLSAMDMAKLGFLYLNKGKWNGKQIVSEDWINKSTQSHYKFNLNNMPYWFSLNGFSDYGYLWWLNDNAGYSASGHYGQAIIVYPKLDLVVVFTSYNNDNSIPFRFTRNIIIPSIKSENALPEKPEFLSNHLIFLKKCEKKAPKNFIPGARF